MKPREKRNRQARLLVRDGPLCSICGLPLGGDITFDHIQPRGEGGMNSIENLRLTHYKCNYDRHP